MTPPIIEPSLDVLIPRIATDLAAKITDTLARQDRFTWVLSGGHTPRRLFETLAQGAYRSAIPWTRVWIFWGDERTVPPHHADSNYRMADEALLKRVPIPAAHVFRMKGELPPAEAAQEYEAQLREVFGAGVVVPSFDLVLLGMGPDGHTASLFPGTPAVEERVRWVVANPVPAMNTTRLTLTLPVLNAAHAVWFIAAGADKASVFSHVRRMPNIAYPASLVKPNGDGLRWYTDTAIVNS